MNENQKYNLNILANNFGLKRLVLFGSAVDSFENARDIDFACEGLTGKKFLRFGVELEELFGRTIDLVQIEEKSRFIEEILKYGVVVYES